MGVRSDFFYKELGTKILAYASIITNRVRKLRVKIIGLANNIRIFS